ncbi:hypothetical protein K437DRAFT_254077 [Tilletiaria anomala UBC 951]|uniref:Uncharacterized protein n=1 Tax=Tilletiaria anomala (strain ATCC 24038 / CBS 436.72 / UBC 951) TaxID=1037660 RepID=A0A066WIW9_TILAU|nr:uncharacterized protein K437DRAFT_254077 [Tilletiaria anomala UBC 951]KDN52493.1 hypothetical protein K437DRAFT_254077 [Tilletiaria anomala UBC 951]
MPSTSARKRNRAALTGEGGWRQTNKDCSNSSSEGNVRLRTLLLVLLATTCSLLALQAYRFYARGTMPFQIATALDGGRGGLSKLTDSLTALLQSDRVEGDALQYDSSQWKARVAKKAATGHSVPLSKDQSAAERLKRAREKLVDLRTELRDVIGGNEAEGGSGGDGLPVEDLSSEDLQAMFDLLQGRGAYYNMRDGKDESHTDDPSAATADAHATREKRFGRLRQAMGAATGGADDL